MTMHLDRRLQRHATGYVRLPYDDQHRENLQGKKMDGIGSKQDTVFLKVKLVRKKNENKCDIYTEGLSPIFM